jgi:hypothetical protein
LRLSASKEPLPMQIIYPEMLEVSLNPTALAEIKCLVSQALKESYLELE